MIFEAPSLRTRLSFETAMTQLHGHAINYYTLHSPWGAGKESIEDFARTPPRVVLVDRYPFQPGFGRTNFDYLAYLSLDPRFRELWCPYRMTGRWEQVFAVYERMPELEARCASR